MRTIVIGDAHGYPWIIQNALDHSGFAPGVDRFIYTGDFLDRGQDPHRCVDLIEQFATTVLVGNHELAVLLEDPITPFDEASALFEPYLRGRVLNAADDEAWQCAAAVDGVLITHAGVPARYRRALDEECDGDVTRFADWLNEQFRESLRASVSRRAVDWEGLLGLEGPFWFRPRIERAELVLPGVVQIAGHTPPRDGEGLLFAERGFFMIDPSVYMRPRRRSLPIRGGRGRTRVDRGLASGCHRSPWREGRAARLVRQR